MLAALGHLALRSQPSDFAHTSLTCICLNEAHIGLNHCQAVLSDQLVHELNALGVCSHLHQPGRPSSLTKLGRQQNTASTAALKCKQGALCSLQFMPYCTRCLGPGRSHNSSTHLRLEVTQVVTEVTCATAPRVDVCEFPRRHQQLSDTGLLQHTRTDW